MLHCHIFVFSRQKKSRRKILDEIDKVDQFVDWFATTDPDNLVLLVSDKSVPKNTIIEILDKISEGAAFMLLPLNRDSACGRVPKKFWHTVDSVELRNSKLQNDHS